MAEQKPQRCPRTTTWLYRVVDGGDVCSLVCVWPRNCAKAGTRGADSLSSPEQFGATLSLPSTAAVCSQSRGEPYHGEGGVDRV